MIEITDSSVHLDDLDGLVRGAGTRKDGAVVTFTGIVRDDGVEGLEIEAYNDAAIEELSRIRAEAVERFGATSVDVVHRTGTVAVGERIVVIVSSAPHRREAFLACEYVIDELKRRVPIWKRELTGEKSRWISP